MKPFKIFCLTISIMLICAMQGQGQSLQYNVANSKHTAYDSLKNADTGIYSKQVPGLYYVSVFAKYTYITGATDTCTCTLQESWDNVNWSAVSGATVKVFKAASENFNWGGSGATILWTSPYSRLYCLKKNTGNVRLAVKFQFKK